MGAEKTSSHPNQTSPPAQAEPVEAPEAGRWASHASDKLSMSGVGGAMATLPDQADLSNPLRLSLSKPPSRGARSPSFDKLRMSGVGGATSAFPDIPLINIEA